MPVLRDEAIEAELTSGKRDEVILELDGKPVRVRNLNKVYFPEPGHTKRELLAWYYSIADRLLPFLRGRPLVLHRYPNGVTGKPFYQKDAGLERPDWIDTVTLASESGRREEITYYLANDRAALLFLTNLGCIEHNPWSSSTAVARNAGLRLLRSRSGGGHRLRHGGQGGARVHQVTRAGRLWVFHQDVGRQRHAHLPAARTCLHLRAGPQLRRDRRSYRGFAYAGADHTRAANREASQGNRLSRLFAERLRPPACLGLQRPPPRRGVDFDADRTQRAAEDT